MGAMRSIGVRLRLWTDQYKQDAQQAVRANQQVGESGAKAKRDLDGLAMGLGVAGTALLGLATIAVVATAKFDKQMSEVGAVANATGDELGQLRDAALAAGAATAFSASEAAQAEAELAKAGVKTADILGGALRGSLDLAAAGSLQLADAATIAAQAMNIFDLSGRDVAHVADVLAAGANKSATSVDQLGIGMQQVGLVAKQVGFSFEETIGLLAAFADNALGGSDGATSLKTALLRLAAPLPEAQAKMKELGISLYDANGQMVGAVEIAGQLEDGLRDLSDAERNAALSTIFGQDAIRAANVLYNLGADDIRKYIEAVDDQGAASDVAAAKLDNLAGDFEALQGSLETLFITGGSGAQGGLRTVVQTLTDITNAIGGLPTPLLTAGIALTGIAGAAMLASAAMIRFAPAVASANTFLLGMGPAGAVAAGGLRAVTVAAGPITAALAGMALANEHWVERLKDPAPLSMIEQIMMAASSTPATQFIWDELTKPGTREGIQLVTEAAEELSAAEQELAGRNIALGGAFGDAANEADGLKKAFDRLNGAMLTWRGAERDAEAAVDDLTTALQESNGSLDVHEASGRAASAAVDELAEAARDAAQAKYDETGSVEAANAVYQDYVGQLRNTLINAGVAADEVDRLIASIASIPPYKAIQLDVQLRGNLSALAVWGRGNIAGMRWGGVMEHAQSGLLRSPARIATRPMVSWAEPETGGEAYVPKRGNYGRSMGILSAAAGWYNADVVPRGSWSGGASSAPPVIVNITGSGGAEAMIEAVRWDVVTVGGGDVQARLGQRGRLA